MTAGEIARAEVNKIAKELESATSSDSDDDNVDLSLPSADEDDGEDGVEEAHEDGYDGDANEDLLVPSGDEDEGEDGIEETQPLNDDDDGEPEVPTDSPGSEVMDHTGPESDAYDSAAAEANELEDEDRPKKTKRKHDDGDYDDDKRRTKRSKERKTHPKWVAKLCSLATADERDVTDEMEELKEWLLNTKPFKGMEYASLVDGVAVVVVGPDGKPVAGYTIQTPNPGVQKAKPSVTFKTSHILVESSDSEGSDGEDATQPPTETTPATLHVKACTTGSITTTGHVQSTMPTWCTGGRQFVKVAKEFRGIFVSRCEIRHINGESVLDPVKTVAYATTGQTAVSFYDVLADDVGALHNHLADGCSVRLCVGPFAHPELKGTMEMLQAALVDYGRTVVADELHDFVKRITDRNLVHALIEDPRMVSKMLPMILAFMFIGPEYARVVPRFMGEEIEWDESPEDAFEEHKVVEALRAIKQPLTSNNGALATWNAISRRAADASTLADCFPPGAIKENIELIQQVAMKLYGIIAAGSFRETMLECQANLMAIKDGKAEPTDPEVAETITVDTGIDLMQMVRQWIIEHPEDADAITTECLESVTHNAKGDRLGSKMLERLAGGKAKLTGQIKKRKAGPEATLVTRLVEAAIGEFCRQPIADGELEEDVVESTAATVAEQANADEPKGVGADIRLLIEEYYVGVYKRASEEAQQRIENAKATRSGRKTKPNAWREKDAADAAPAKRRRQTDDH